MGQIVFTVIENLEQLQAATWSLGDQSSYEKTATRVARHCFPGQIGLIGRRDKYGRVDPCYAVRVLSNGSFESRRIDGWHIKLAQFFLIALKHAPVSDVLRPFIDDLPESIANAARQLISLRCGAGKSVDDDAVRIATNDINVNLKALGIPIGDWTFLPMICAYNAN